MKELKAENNLLDSLAGRVHEVRCGAVLKGRNSYCSIEIGWVNRINEGMKCVLCTSILKNW